jgi:hypothetical protein
LLVSSGQQVPIPQGSGKSIFKKMDERTGNIHENKGSAFDNPTESWNVIENKDSYTLRAGMLLKTQHVTHEPFSRPGRLV